MFISVRSMFVMLFGCLDHKSGFGCFYAASATFVFCLLDSNFKHQIEPPYICCHHMAPGCALVCLCTVHLGPTCRSLP